MHVYMQFHDHVSWALVYTSKVYLCFYILVVFPIILTSPSQSCVYANRRES